MRWLKRLLSDSQTITAVILLALWEAGGRISGSVNFPPPTKIVAAGMVLFEKNDLAANLFSSLQELLLGAVLAVGLGVLVGLLMALSRRIEYALDIYLNLFLAAPMAALVPVLIMIFGLGKGTVVATIFVFSFFVVCVNTFTGIRQVDRTLPEMARSFGATRRQIVREVILPAARPLILAGIRMGVGRAVNGLVIGEMLIVVNGLGGLIMFIGGSFMTDALLALILLVIAIGLVMTGLISFIEHRLGPQATSRKVREKVAA